MTIANTITQVRYPCNGVTTAFAFNNKVFAATDLAVNLITAARGEVVSTLVYGTDYTVANVDVDTGCTVNTTVAYSSLYAIDIRSSIANVQSTSIKNQGDFYPELHEEAFDKLTREVQDLRRLAYTYGLHGPDNESTPWPALPSASGRANTYPVFDSGGLLSVASSLPSSTLSQGTIGQFLYPQTAAELAASVTPTYFYYPPLDVRRYGATNSNTDGLNLAALNNAILVAKASTAAGSKGGQVITVPADCHYGYQVANKTTWPQFSGTVPITVYDYSQGSSYSGFPTAYDGNQVRIFSYTPQTTSAGNHDGNNFFWRGAWAPNFCLSNDMDLSGARAATDNRRTHLLFGNNGSFTWVLGKARFPATPPPMNSCRTSRFINTRLLGTRWETSEAL